MLGLEDLWLECQLWPQIYIQVNSSHHFSGALISEFCHQAILASLGEIELSHDRFLKFSLGILEVVEVKVCSRLNFWSRNVLSDSYFRLLLTSKMYDRPLNDIHVCVGYKCVSDTYVCRMQVSVGDMISLGHVSLILESELYL